MNLFNDDCLEKMKDIKDEQIDLLFCDLPYGETSCKWDCEIDLDLFWKEINRICKKTCPMIFTCSIRFGNTLINSNPKNFRYDLVWQKSASSGFLNAKKMPLKKHEMIYVFYRKLPQVYTENIKLHHTHKFIKKEKGRDKNIYKEIKSCDLKEYEPPLPNTILEFKSEKGKHSTQKPVSLMLWILKYYSRENDIVLDPTMGSGSMGVACNNLNRNFIGIEKDEKIYASAVERINK